MEKSGPSSLLGQDPFSLLVVCESKVLYKSFRRLLNTVTGSWLASINNEKCINKSVTSVYIKTWPLVTDDLDYSLIYGNQEKVILKV